MRRVRITGETSGLNAVERFGSAGRSLGSYLSEAEGFDVLLSDPFGSSHRVSLAPFAGEDPNRFLVFQFVVSREDEDFDQDYGNAVVLKEYDLPAGTQLPA